MAVNKRMIGLSLGADLCWPACYEAILEQLRLRIPHRNEVVEVGSERVTVEPFDLGQPCKYSVVLDRLTHWFHTSREWIKKIVIMDGAYVLNNPWSLQSMEKHTSYAAMMRLGLPIPDTWLIPPKEHLPSEDLAPTLERYAQHFDLPGVGESIGYPLFMKPYDGGGWVGVSRIDGPDELLAAYEVSGSRVMHLQKAVHPHDLFVRALGVGPQINVIPYDPGAPLHDRYKVAFNVLDGDEWGVMSDMALTINSFFGWDFNSCEALRNAEGVFQPIDFANACPDSQVTSLHFYFPWLVKALLRWSIFCAVTERTMRQNLDWQPFFDIAARDLPYRERLAAYADIARERMEADRFAEFCETHLSHLDEVTWEFFGTPECKRIIGSKVEALFPAHEVEQFTEHFWGLIQFWRKTDADARRPTPTPTRTPTPEKVES
jgi:hypothetical protein